VLLAVAILWQNPGVGKHRLVVIVWLSIRQNVIKLSAGEETIPVQECRNFFFNPSPNLVPMKREMG